MASSPWSQSPVPTPGAPGAAVYDLRPLTLGEILDRTFSVYRSRFWLFAGICSTAALVQLVLGGVHVAIIHSLHPRLTTSALQTAGTIINLAVTLLVSLAFCVLHAATVYALGEIYLGRPATIGDSLRAVGRHWLRYIGIGIWQMASLFGVGTLVALPGYILLFRGVATNGTAMVLVGTLLVFAGIVGGGVLGVILYLRNALGMPASVIEGSPVRASMRRSKALTRGAKGRLFVVMLVGGALYMVAGALQAPLLIMVVQATLHHGEALGAQAVMLLVQFLTSSVVPPVTLIGFALVYFDERIRKEAFDLELLLGEPVAAATQPAGAAADLPQESWTSPDPWTPPAQARFLTADSPQQEPTGAVHAALVSPPESDEQVPGEVVAAESPVSDPGAELGVERDHAAGE